MSAERIPFDANRFTIRPMTLRDIDGVLRVEHRAFTAPWSRQAFLTELVDNQFARYVVAVCDDRIVGYAGVWLIIDEGHVTNIAVDPDFRGHHLGEALLKTLMSSCIARGISRMTLEVRVSNTVAQRLYEKFGFATVGIRKGYYTDNGEDANIMWVTLPGLEHAPNLDDASSLDESRDRSKPHGLGHAPGEALSE